jgi:predicted RNase H-like nuclease (RuvC/YqgF family)
MSGIDERHAAAVYEVSQLLGIDASSQDPVERLRLGRGVALRLEIDKIDALQLAGQPIDIMARVRAAEALEEMVSPAADEEPDLSHLSDDELQVLTRARSIVDGHGDPKNEQPLKEAAERLERERESHRATISVMQTERRQREELTALCAERWKEIQALTAKIAEQALHIEALNNHTKSQEGLISMYRKLAPQVEVAAGKRRG